MRRRPRDHGFSLIEVLLVTTLLGLVVGALSGAFVVIVRTSPSTEFRIDDARTTRGLATWLSHDVASTPPFHPPIAGRGGFDTGNVNACGAPASTTNLVQLTWVESGYSQSTHIVSYRLDSSGESLRISRYSCGGESSSQVNLTSGLTDVAPVHLQKNGSGVVTVVEFRLTGQQGETVIVDTSSRNPSAFFPT